MNAEELQKLALWAARAEDEAGIDVQIGRARGPAPESERALQSYAYVVERLTHELKRTSIDEAARVRLREVLELLSHRLSDVRALLRDSAVDQAWRTKCAELDGALLQLEPGLVQLLGEEVRQLLPQLPVQIGLRRDSVRTVLEARKIELGAHGAELDACLDPKVLHQWLVRAATANSIEEVFAVAS